MDECKKIKWEKTDKKEKEKKKGIIRKCRKDMNGKNTVKGAWRAFESDVDGRTCKRTMMRACMRTSYVYTIIRDTSVERERSGAEPTHTADSVHRSAAFVRKGAFVFGHTIRGHGDRGRGSPLIGSSPSRLRSRRCSQMFIVSRPVRSEDRPAAASCRSSERSWHDRWTLTRPCRRRLRPCMTDSCSAARPRTFARALPRN